MDEAEIDTDRTAILLAYEGSWRVTQAILLGETNQPMLRDALGGLSSPVSRQIEAR